MKKILMGSTLLLLTCYLHAQPPQPPTHEMRWRHDSSCILHSLPLTPQKLQRLHPAFEDFYSAMDRLHDQDRAQPPARGAVEQLVKQRDARILPELTREEADDFLRMEHRLLPPPPPGDVPPPPASR
ncbi:hypothetical protein [Flaviaesturariibacter terrae]